MSKKKKKTNLKSYKVSVEFQSIDTHEEVVSAKNKKEALEIFYQRNYLDGEILDESVKLVGKRTKDSL